MVSGAEAAGGSFLGDSAFLLGLARTIGLEPRYVAETGDAPADLRARMELAHQRLDEGDTFVFSHLKATDMAGHTKDPQIKKSTIEALDGELGDLPTDHAIVCVTGDHATWTKRTGEISKLRMRAAISI